MDLALQVAGAVAGLAALGLSILVYVRQQRANAHADVSVWFEVHESGKSNKTYMVVKNHGPGMAKAISAKFFDVKRARVGASVGVRRVTVSALPYRRPSRR
jgi:hypothetical protein